MPQNIWPLWRNCNHWAKIRGLSVVNPRTAKHDWYSRKWPGGRVDLLTTAFLIPLTLSSAYGAAITPTDLDENSSKWKQRNDLILSWNSSKLMLIIFSYSWIELLSPQTITFPLGNIYCLRINSLETKYVIPGAKPYIFKAQFSMKT